MASHLLRQMMSADVEGSFAGFFSFGVLPLRVGGGGVLEALPLGAASTCALFFFFAMSPTWSCADSCNRRLLCCGLIECGIDK